LPHTGERDVTHRICTTYFYIQFPLSNSISLMVYWLAYSFTVRQVRVSRFDPGQYVVLYELSIFNYQFRNWCLPGIEPEYLNMVSELSNPMTTNWYRSFISLNSGQSMLLTLSWKLFTLFCSRRSENNSPYFSHDGLQIIHPICSWRAASNSLYFAHDGLKIIQSISLTPNLKLFTLFRSRRAEKNSPLFSHDGLKISTKVNHDGLKVPWDD
jgi:hypothetical protein